MLALNVFRPPLVRQWELNLYDAFLLFHADGKEDGFSAIVDIDEPSLAAQGQWPWPRYRLGRLVERLRDAGAAAIGLDIMLSEADRSSVDTVLRELTRERGVTLRVEGLPDELRDNDRLLAHMLRQCPVVLSGFLHFAGNTGQETTLPPANARHTLPRGIGVVEMASGNATYADHLLTAVDLTPPLPELAASAAVAFFNASLDQDSLVRRMPVLAQCQGQVYANLSLRGLMMGLGVDTLRLHVGPDGLESVSAGPVSFPVAPDGSLLIPYRGPGRTFPYISASDVLDGTFDPELVRDRVIFIGSSAAGIKDIRATPLDRYLPGVETHATLVDAILSGRTIATLPWTPGLQCGVIVLLGGLAVLLFSLAPLMPALLGGAALVAASVGISWHLFRSGVWISPLWAALIVVAEAAMLIMVRFWLAERDRRRIRTIFSHYVSPEVVSRIVDRGEDALRGEQRELSVMFTDLRGFTSLSEGLTPEKVVSLLNRYFTPMTALVRNSGGTLDKFIGDALMAFWNAPLDVPDHPERAVRTALDMLEELKTFNLGLVADTGITLRMGVGIHTGLAAVGNMGSDDLTSYTAVGDTVNLASRLEGLCSRYGVSLAVSGETASRCGAELVRQHMVRLRVKGRAEPVDVYTLMSPEQAVERATELAAWEEATALYHLAVERRDTGLLTQAAQAFDDLQAQWPGKLHEAYVDACAAMRRQAPETWSAVWTLTGK